MKDKCLFEDYYKKYYNSVFAYILKRVTDQSLAEDITMNVFLSAFEHFESFDPDRASFATWIYTITNNKLKNTYRDKKDILCIDDIDLCDAPIENGIEIAERLGLMREYLSNALDTVTEFQKKIVIYKYYYDYDSLKISQLLGMTSVNVRVQLSRALKKLKQYFIDNNIDWEM